MLLTSLIAMLSIVFFCSQPQRTKDTEFQNGSGICFTSVTAMQTENLFRLAKIWGFVKYRHPAVTSGTLNWDAELFRIIPPLLETSDVEEANVVIFDWLNKFPFNELEMFNRADIFEQTIILRPNLDWLEDRNTLGDDLGEYLTRLAKVTIPNTPKGYAYYNSKTHTANMDAEYSYSEMKYNDTGLRLLALFRYWNIIEYFYPYKDIMNENWDTVLQEMLPQFIAGQDEQSYVLSIARLSTYIHDSHAIVGDPQSVLINYFGRNTPPVEYVNVNGEIVISAISENPDAPTSLELGDIVLSMDGVSIENRIQNCRKYISLSNDNLFVQSFGYYLLGTSKGSASMEVLRDSKPLSLNVICYERRSQISGQEPSGFLEGEQIGYINPLKLIEVGIDRLMTQFKDTKGLIIDLRNRPTEYIPYTFAKYLIPSQVPFAKFGLCNWSSPGEFLMSPPLSSGRNIIDKVFGKPLYQNPVVILMDERSISLSEFTIMSLYNAPQVVVIGSPSNGTNGNNVTFSLPGDVIAKMTGQSVFYSDCKPTQRIGLVPDSLIIPTVKEIAAGKDTLLAAAISIILNE